MRGVSKDVQSLLKRAKKAGWSVELTKNNHIRLVCSKGTVFCPMTPSDWRSLKDVERKMRAVEAGQ